MVHPDLERQIIFENNKNCFWIIESPKLFAKYVNGLYLQSEGGSGGFVLSDYDKELDIGKNMEVIINPFDISLNDKKVINKLYAELSELAYAEDMYVQTQEITSKLKEYIMQLEYLSPYMLEFELDMAVDSIFKAIGLKAAGCTDDFYENMNIYIKIVAGLMRKKLMVFINIGNYLEKEQIEQLIKTAMYNEIYLLLIESTLKDYSNEFSCYIIDKDGCEI